MNCHVHCIRQNNRKKNIVTRSHAQPMAYLWATKLNDVQTLLAKLCLPFFGSSNFVNDLRFVLSFFFVIKGNENLFNLEENSSSIQVH